MLVAIVILVAIAASLVYSFVRTPEYKAIASIQFTEPDEVLDLIGGAGMPPFNADKIAAARISTVTSPAVLRLAIDRLKEASAFEIGLRPLRERLSASVNPENNLVEVGASATNGPEAIQIVNTVAGATAEVQNALVRDQFAQNAAALDDELRALRKENQGSNDPGGASRELELQTNIGRLESASKIATVAQVVERAGGELAPDSPRPVRDTLLAAFLGLFLGIGAALLREALDRRLHSTTEIQTQLDLPVLGLVRDSAMGLPVVSPNGTGQLEARDVESYRIMRNNLAFLDIDKRLRSVIVTSALPEEGKSTVAASIAQTSAAAGIRTLLLECDLRRPSLPGRLGLSSEPGLIDYLVRQYDVNEVLQQVNSGVDVENVPGALDRAPQLTCITAGSQSPRPAEALGSERFKKFLEEMQQQYDFVVIDTSPLLSVVDTREIVPLVDGVLLCVRVSRTTRDQMVAAKDALSMFGSRPTGIIVTAVKDSEEPDYGYYSFYH